MLEKKGLVKLVEECGELIQIASKKMTRMDSDDHWDKKGSLSERLEDEMADVIAAISSVAINLKLNAARMDERVIRKAKMFRQWMNEEDTEIT